MKAIVFSLVLILSSISAQAVLIYTPPPTAAAGDTVQAVTRPASTSYNYLGGRHFGETVRPAQTVCYDGSQKVACPQTTAESRTPAPTAVRAANPGSQGNGYKPAAPSRGGESGTGNQYAQPDGN